MSGKVASAHPAIKRSAQPLKRIELKSANAVKTNLNDITFDGKPLKKYLGWFTSSKAADISELLKKAIKNELKVLNG